MLLSFTDQKLDKVIEELLNYQALSTDDMPQSVWDNAVCYEVGEDFDEVIYHRMDTIWGHIIKLPGRTLEGILNSQIPHSNAGEEWVFSVIRKIKRDDRGRLQLQGTLSSLS